MEEQWCAVLAAYQIELKEEQWCAVLAFFFTREVNIWSTICYTCSLQDGFMVQQWFAGCTCSLLNIALVVQWLA